jgi:hypothetical protein
MTVPVGLLTVTTYDPTPFTVIDVPVSPSIRTPSLVHEKTGVGIPVTTIVIVVGNVLTIELVILVVITGAIPTPPPPVLLLFCQKADDIIN